MKLGIVICGVYVACLQSNMFTGVRSFKNLSILSVTLTLSYCLKQLKMQITPEELRKEDETATLSPFAG